MGIEKTFIFDLNLLEANINWGDVWIDQYENGKFKQRLLNLGSSVTFTKVNEPTYKTLTLGVIAQGRQTANIPEDFFVSEEARMKELLANDIVYVLRCSFK